MRMVDGAELPMGREYETVELAVYAAVAHLAKQKDDQSARAELLAIGQRADIPPALALKALLYVLVFSGNADENLSILHRLLDLTRMHPREGGEIALPFLRERQARPPPEAAIQMLAAATQELTEGGVSSESDARIVRRWGQMVSKSPSFRGL